MIMVEQNKEQRVELRQQSPERLTHLHLLERSQQQQLSSAGGASVRPQGVCVCVCVFLQELESRSDLLGSCSAPEGCW